MASPSSLYVTLVALDGSELVLAGLAPVALSAVPADLLPATVSDGTYIDVVGQRFAVRGTVTETLATLEGQVP